MGTIFDLESELVDYAYSAELARQDSQEEFQEVDYLGNALTYETDALELLEGTHETLPEMLEEDNIVNQFTMECAIGVTGSQAVGMGCSLEVEAIEDKSGATTEQQVGGWKKKLLAMYAKLKELVVNFFKRVGTFIENTWGYLNDRTVRLVATLESLRKSVAGTDKVPRQTIMNRRPDNHLSKNGNDAISQLEHAKTVFSSFNKEVYPRAINFCEEYIKAVIKFYDKRELSEHAEEMNSAFAHLGKLLDFSNVKHLIVGIGKDTDMRSIAVTDSIMGKWIAGFYDTEAGKTSIDPSLLGLKYNPTYAIPFIGGLTNAAKVGEDIDVLKKEQLLEVIDITIGIAKNFDRDLVAKMKRLTMFRSSYLSYLDRRFGSGAGVPLREGEERKAAMAIQFGIRILNSLLNSVNRVTNIHTQAIQVGAYYALDSFKQYR